MESTLWLKFRDADNYPKLNNNFFFHLLGKKKEIFDNVFSFGTILDIVAFLLDQGRMGRGYCL